VTDVRPGLPIDCLEGFEDGESIVIIYRSSSGELEEREAEFCGDPSLLVDGVPCLEYYLYAPDGATDFIRLSDVVEVRRDPHRPPFGS
jgi:hypothetical protein